MNVFLFVRCRTTEGAEVLRQRISRAAGPTLPFIPQRQELFRRRADVFFSAQAGDPFGHGRHWCTVPVLAFDGFPYVGRPPVLGLAEQLLMHVEKSPEIDAAYERLHGQYALLHVDEDNTAHAFGDCSGSKPLFYAMTDEFTAVANRQSLLAASLTDNVRPHFDLDAMAFPIGYCHAFGTSSMFRGVQLLVPGRRIEIAADASVRIKDFRTQIWSSTTGTHSRPTQADFDAATDDLIRSFAAVNALTGDNSDELGLSLTGGKDSRLNLALALKAGLGERLRIFTYGHPESPEAQVARHLCDLVGVKHHAVHGGPGDDLDPDEAWKRLRYAGFRFDFCHGGVDGGYMPATTPSAAVDLTGAFADIFRRVWPHTRKTVFVDAADAKARLENWPLAGDPLRLLRPEVRGNLNAQIHAWADAKLASGIDLNDLPEVYYVENRMTWWAGTINAANFGRHRLMPLASLTAAKIGMSMSRDDRERELLHFEVLRRLSPDLLAAPFLNDTWHPETRAIYLGQAVAQAPFAVRPYSSPPRPSWFAHFISTDIGRIRAYLLDDCRSPLFDIIDYDRLQVALSEPQKCTGIVEARQVLNAILMRMALTGDTTYPKDDVRENKSAAPAALEVDRPLVDAVLW
jgi:hypothetical protein